MRQWSWMRVLVALTMVFFLAGCESMGFPLRSGRSLPPPPAVESAPVPGVAGQPPAPSSDLSLQVQALQIRVHELENRLAALEGPKSAPSASVRIPAKPPAPLRPSSADYPKAGTVADKTYNDGYSLYQSKKYDAARKKFHRYLKSHPRGSKAPEARYYLADSFYQEGKYKEAAVEFNKTARQYPRSILAPAALLRQALSYQKQKQNNFYRSTLRKLVKAYPQSPEAKEAQKWLKEAGR